MCGRIPVHQTERGTKMTDEQIDKMLEMHRYLMKCEIRQAFDKVSQNDRAAVLQEQFNDTKWDDFAKWLRIIRDKE
jgi:hypothetical protein